MPLLIDGYDSVLLDLDGVVYLGPIAVPEAPEALAALRGRGVRVGFVTNNAARPPGAVAAHLVELGIAAEPTDVVTSAQAGARLVLERVGAGSRVLLVGGEGVREALDEAGLVAVSSADDEPVAVLQGWGVDLTWQQLNEAAIAVQRGAWWVATNIDPTRPTDRGLVPGNGMAVDAVRVAVDVDPVVAGKPFRPLLTETVARLGTNRPLLVGDRLDTDIAGAVNAEMDSMLVLTGSHGPAELLAAAPGFRPTHLGHDLRALLQPARSVQVDGDIARCGAAVVRVDAETLALDAPLPDDPEGRADVLWAAARLSWRAADAGRLLDAAGLIGQLATPPR